jgi:hypothetical protein
MNNTANGNGGAIYNSSGATVAVNNSCISGNSNASVYRWQSPAIDYTGNWWGAADGPSGSGPGSGDTVSNNILYANFLTTDTVCQP